MYLSRLLLAIYGAGVTATLGELLLLEHYEDLWQRVPIAALGLAVIVALWYAMRPSRQSHRVFLSIGVIFAVAGTAGLILHYRGNVEFARENDPSLRGMQLVWEAMTGATPALAPGAMIFLGLVGYAAAVATPKSWESPLSKSRS